MEFWTKSNKVAFDNSLCGSNWSLVISWDPWGVHVGTGTMSLAHDVAGAKSSLRWDRSDNFWCRAVCWLIDSDWPSIGWQIVFFVHDINNAESSLHWQNFFYLVLSFWSVDWFRSTQHRLEYCPSLCMMSSICYLLSSAFIIITVIIISVLNSLCLPRSKRMFHSTIMLPAIIQKHK